MLGCPFHKARLVGLQRPLNRRTSSGNRRRSLSWPSAGVRRSPVRVTTGACDHHSLPSPNNVQAAKSPFFTPAAVSTQANPTLGTSGRKDGRPSSSGTPAVPANGQMRRTLRQQLTQVQVVPAERSQSTSFHRLSRTGATTSVSGLYETNSPDRVKAITPPKSPYTGKPFCAGSPSLPKKCENEVH